MDDLPAALEVTGEELTNLLGIEVLGKWEKANNAAERSLRALVISRKISGGTRSATGTKAKMSLASLFGTWRVQGRNPYDACHELLASP
ncbi:hypothetical protein BH20CHL3_BH20CHL3_06980 [soil metagenome]